MQGKERVGDVNKLPDLIAFYHFQQNPPPPLVTLDDKKKSCEPPSA